MKKIIIRVAIIILTFLPINKKTVLIIENSFPSGSNTRIIIQKLKVNFDTTVIKYSDIYSPIKNMNELINKIKLLIYISKFEVIIATHGTIKLNKKQILIDLWHGIPIKSMGMMESNVGKLRKPSFNMDYLITTSKLNSVLMSSCMHLNYSKLKTLGSPRNDYLYEQNTNNMKRIINDNKYEKIILYMPTFRQGHKRSEGRKNKSIINFGNSINENEFLTYLKNKQYLLIMKMHPIEENEMINQLNIKNSENIFILSSKLLKDEDMDLYELFTDIDLLITDYSSVYFDFLLLDKPIIFINDDIELYRNDRGILLEPYEYWTPGYKVTDYPMLLKRINDSFFKDEFKEKRKEIKDLFHLHQDGKSCDRVIDFIEELIKK